jgi:hypothetical protein
MHRHQRGDRKRNLPDLRKPIKELLPPSAIAATDWPRLSLLTTSIDPDDGHRLDEILTVLDLRA